MTSEPERVFHVEGQPVEGAMDENPEPFDQTKKSGETGEELREDESLEQVVKTTRETLKCYLTQDERNELTSQMVMAIQDASQAEADLKAVTTQYKKDIAAKAALIKSCSQKLANGYEMRAVDCQIVHDYQNHTVTVFRMDTEEMVRTRIMTADELQRLLL